VPVYLFLDVPKYFLESSFPDTLSLWSALKMWEYLSQQYNVTNKINFWGLNMKITLIFNGMPFRIVDAEEPGFFFFTVEDTYIPED
jgi:hypothetical protein